MTVSQQAARHLFGTDGIRGVAGEFPLDPRTTFAIGRALGLYLARQHASLHVVIGMDTRESGPQIAEHVAAGLASAEATAESAGVITTPGVAYLARTRDFAAGIVISASHNPWRDNGIKIFGHDGFKLSDAAEMEIEAIIFSEINGSAVPPPILAPLHHDSSLDHDYAEWLLNHVSGRLGGIRAVIDCANGAAVDLAPEVFDRAGLRAVFTHNQADGRNINEGCGALHPETVAGEVKLRALDLGICFDGDADRVLFADADGRVVNGDGLLLLAARELKSRNALKGDLVVATTMSNLGLEAALKRSGIKMLRAPVGDKYVLEEMNKTGATLGGEQSGHILFRDGDATTGDGLLTALRILQIIARSGKFLAELLSDFKVFPQTIQNIRVREKRELKDIPAVADAIAAAERSLDGNGRVIVRYSGTEKLARVMVEAESEDLVRKFADSISGAIRASIGE